MTTTAKERVEAEREELRDRLNALLAFGNGPNFRNLPAMQRGLLTGQGAIMQAYDAVLTARLQAWEDG